MSGTLRHTTMGRADAAWFAATVLACALMALLPLALDGGFYYFDDTAGGAFGQWWELGQQLRRGRWPMLSLDSGYAGNYLVEGQWGLYSPVVWVIALASTTASDAAAFSAAVKVFFLVTGGAGVYALTRSFGARPPYALLAGIAAPVAGFTFYLDATTWVTNLQVWTWFAWSWWALRRHAYGRGSLAVAFVPGFLLLAVGYVQGTLMLVVLYAGLLAEQALARRLDAAVRTLVAGVAHGLVAVTVFLPGFASAGITVRASSVGNDGFMTLTLNGLAVSVVPLGRADLSGWWGRYAPMPYTYVAWFLPLVALVPAATLRAVARRFVAAGVVAGAALLLAVGPSQLGPLRFPVRSMPWLATVLIVVACVALSALHAGTPRRRFRLVVTSAWVVVAYWLAVSAYTASWKQNLVMMAATLVVVAAAWWASAWDAGAPGAGWRRFAVPALLVAMTVGTFGVQARTFVPTAHSFWGVDGVPSSIGDLSAPLDGARGEVAVIGDPLALGAVVWHESGLGNMWYLKPNPTLNVYSPVGFAALARDLCMDPYYGRSCYGGIDTLFSIDPDTGRRVVDLLGLDTIQVLADPDDPDASVAALQARYPVPSGWRLADADDTTFTWVREDASGPFGVPTWVTPGVEFDLLSNTDEEIRLRVTAVPDGGGQVVLSRLAWPGYSASSGATVAAPLRGYLLRLDIAPDAVGREIVVTFRPPLWGVQVAALALAVLGVAGLTVAGAVRRRRERTTPTVPV